MKVNCPTCKTTVDWSPKSEFKPFCSQRCKLIDLGEWASEGHVIKGQTLKPELTGQIDEFDLEAEMFDQDNFFIKD